MDSQIVLDKMFGVLRDTGSSLTALELCLQVLAWVKLSDLEKLPAELKVPEQTSFYNARTFIEGVDKALTYASDHSEDIDHTHLFFGTSSRYESLPISQLLRLLYISQDALQKGWLDSFSIPASAYQSVSTHDSSMLLPNEVISLMTGLVPSDPSSAQRIDCLYDDFALFSCSASKASSVSKANGVVYLESFVPNSIPWLTNVLSGLDFSIEFGKFLAQPVLSRDASRKKRDIAIASIPIGKTSNQTIRGQDRFDDSLITTNSMSVLAILDIIEQTSQKAILAVPNTVLFGRGAARSLRQILVDRGIVESVIGMHPALLFKTNLQFSILILNFKDRQKHIQFIDGSADVFINKDGLNRAYLAGWKHLIDTVQQDTVSVTTRTVPIEEVTAADYQLEASWYVLSPKLSAAYGIIRNPKANHIQTQLGECAEIVRPSPRLYKDGKREVLEVITSDFPDFGYLYPPEKVVYVNDQALLTIEAPLFVHPHDILISVKGTTGKVAIAPTAVPPPGEAGWLANQSCLILRAQKKHIDPIVLFMYLKSDIGQVLLEQIVSGATTALIQLQPLKNLSILIPNEEDSRKVVGVFTHQVDLQQQIRQLRQEQSQLGRTCWGLN